MEFFYWEQAAVHRRVFGLLSYKAHYRAAGSRSKGDLTPNYSVLPPRRLEYVARLMPDAKLILIVRHPVERTWSATRRLLPRYFKAVPSDAETIIAFLERESWIHEFSDYPAIVDRWARVYPKQALLVLSFDEIRNRPEQALRRTCDHLGLTTDLDFSKFDLEARVNVNPEMAMPTAVHDYLRARYATILDEMTRRGLWS